MTTLKIKLETTTGLFITDHGTFDIQSLNNKDDIVMDIKTGEIYFITDWIIDEKGHLSGIVVDNNPPAEYVSLTDRLNSTEDKPKTLTYRILVRCT